MRPAAVCVWGSCGTISGLHGALMLSSRTCVRVHTPTKPLLNLLKHPQTTPAPSYQQLWRSPSC